MLTVCFSFVQYQLNKDKMNFSTLRNIQGLHAPLKLQMEYRAARQVCLVKSACLSNLTHFQWLIFRYTTVLFSSQIQRLPFLSSSNLALDTLRGSDESIGFEDILNGQDVIVLHCFWPNDIYVYF